MFLHSKTVTRMQLPEAFAFWKGDMEAHYMAHRLTRYYRCNQCCDFCLCTSKKNAPLSLSWGDLSLRALWRYTLTMSDPNDPSPWTQVPRFEKSKRLIDLLRIVHLGTLRDLISSAIIDSLEDGSMGQFYGMQGQPWNSILHRVSYHASLWAKDQNMPLYIGTLTKARLNRGDYAHYPYAELDSRIKASKVRTLFAFITFLMTRLALSSALHTEAARFHAKRRATCCWALDVALSVWSLCPVVRMAERHVQEVVWLCRLHSATYQWLAHRCLTERRLLYKIKPKSHYFQHLLDHFQSTRLSLMHLSTFMDEDYMGKVRTLCRACHGSTYMQTWARRYVLKRALQWRELQKG